MWMGEGKFETACKKGCVSRWLSDERTVGKRRLHVGIDGFSRCNCSLKIGTAFRLDTLLMFSSNNKNDDASSFLSSVATNHQVYKLRNRSRPMTIE